MKRSKLVTILMATIALMIILLNQFPLKKDVTSEYLDHCNSIDYTHALGNVTIKSTLKMEDLETIKIYRGTFGRNYLYHNEYFDRIGEIICVV